MEDLDEDSVGSTTLLDATICQHIEESIHSVVQRLGDDDFQRPEFMDRRSWLLIPRKKKRKPKEKKTVVPLLADDNSDSERLGEVKPMRKSSRVRKPLHIQVESSSDSELMDDDYGDEDYMTEDDVNNKVAKKKFSRGKDISNLMSTVAKISNSVRDEEIDKSVDNKAELEILKLRSTLVKNEKNQLITPKKRASNANDYDEINMNTRSVDAARDLNEDEDLLMHGVECDGMTDVQNSSAQMRSNSTTRPMRLVLFDQCCHLIDW